MRRGRPRYPQLLTPREQEVLDLLRRGLTNQQIADELGISRAGAAYHVSEILSKLQVPNRQAAASLPPTLTRQRAWGAAGLLGLLRRPSLAAVTKASGAAVIAGAVGILAVIALGVGITALRDDDADSSLACVTGPEAVNPVTAAGQKTPAYAFFETIAEGEAFICLDVPQMAEVNGWFVSGVNATRTQDLAAYRDGEYATADNAFRYLGIGYLNQRLDGLITFDFTVYPVQHAQWFGLPDQPGPDCTALRLPIRPTVLEKTTARIRGHEAYVAILADLTPDQGRRLIVCWREEDLIYSAYARYGDPIDPERDILPFLESVER